MKTAALSESPVILVAEDDPDTGHILQHHLQKAGFTVELVADGKAAMARMADDVLVGLFDLKMPKATGMDCLQYVREKFPDTPVIVMSAFGEIQDAVQAMRMGAFHYLTKPFQPDELIAQVRHAIRAVELARDNKMLRQAISPPMPSTSFVGQSQAVQALLEQVRKIAALTTNVVITGESGTGKTTLARLIHQQGPRAEHPFIAVSCAALPRDLIEAELFGHERGAFTGAVGSRPGRAEVADRGTLFLDEIGDLPLDLQPKLLTFLEDRVVQRLGGVTSRRVDVRFIAATHRDLPAMCRERSFREDLFYRLNVLPLRIPPLRERREDIPLLVDTILARIAGQRGVQPFSLSEAALAMLTSHDWPGNVRELENVLERASAFVSQSSITEQDLFVSIGRNALEPSAPMRDGQIVTLEELERQALVHALKVCNGKKSLAAQRLGISEKSIYNKMKRLNIAG